MPQECELGRFFFNMVNGSNIGVFSNSVYASISIAKQSGATGMADPFLELNGISKTYPGVTALDGVDAMASSS